mmetsp:Transcript_101387/g.292189  ORF Transcript_101387/g.292189 Transcript_101387/m.292189 type:complete len:120 (-) Transcript_101387:131-490(-)
MDARRQDLSERDKDQRALALFKKFYELTYDRGCNISTPEGAAAAIEELGYGSAKDAVEYLNRGGGFEEVRRADSFAKREKDIHGVPHFVITGEGGSNPQELHGAQQANSFLRAFRRITQ